MLPNCIEARATFEAYWNNPNYTQIELDDVDVNETITYYLADEPVHLAQEMLWDIEKKKAWDPGTYLPDVVRTGSSKSWGKQACPITKGDIFVRTTDQKRWLNPEAYETVYEEVYVNPIDKIITFIGTKSLLGKPDLSPEQPVFCVQHSAGGTENRPLNKWRIVHLTKQKDERLTARFNSFNQPKFLPRYIEVYIEKDLGVSIASKN